MAGGDRRMRADAQRNRQRLLAAAVAAFSQEGPEATLESIAKDAGVGIGTLYAKRGISDALRKVIAAGGNPLVGSRSRLPAAPCALMKAGDGRPPFWRRQTMTRHAQQCGRADG